MNNPIPGNVIGDPISSVAYLVERPPKGFLPDPASQYPIPSTTNESPAFKQDKVDSVINRMNKLGKKADNFVHGVREHVRLSPKISETLKGKLSLGARILQVGGVERVFKHFLGVREGEKLLTASQCYLSTTSGPMAGLLFISIDRIAFCSERSIKLYSPEGELVRIHYKVMIPLRKIKRGNQSMNMKKPSQKFIEIVTVDNFDFWFMGFLNYQKTFKCLQQAISQASTSFNPHPNRFEHKC